MNNSSLSHTKWKCRYHIVFIPKYRKKKLYGQIKVEVREILKKLCEYKNVEIVEGTVCADHIHLCVSIPPKFSVSDFMGYLKGKSALMEIVGTEIVGTVPFCQVLCFGALGTHLRAAFL